MLVDLHTHTKRYSPCSSIKPRDLVLRAKEIGLDGLAITEHNHLWSMHELEKLKEEAGIRDLTILRGKEIEREGKHLLIFNYPYKIGRWPPLIEMISKIRHSGGIVILVHPFRYGRFMGVSLNSLKDLFAPYDAVEVLTPQHSSQQIQKALMILEKLPIVGIGASDCHAIYEVGQYVTEFNAFIRSEEDLAQAIRDGSCRPLFFNHQYLRKPAADLRANKII
jgi:predicted metal-dependent phosphoesterase TrpH